MYKNYKIAALCISKISSPRSFNLLKALNEALTSSGYRLFIYNTFSDLYWKTSQEKGERTVFDLIDYNIIDAVIYFNEAFNDTSLITELHSRACACKIPFIPIGGVLPGCPSIIFDFETGFEKIVRHVIEEHKITDVHFIAGRRNDQYSDARINVFKKVLSENGIEYSPSMLSYGDFWSKPARAAVERLIMENRLPKAFICANDSMAIAACELLQKKGCRIPEDIIVTGFDGIDDAQNCIPPITTCECDYKSIADAVMHILSGSISSTPAESIYKIPYSPRIAVSCGCQKTLSTNDISIRLKRMSDYFNWYQEDERHLYEVVSASLGCSDALSLAEELSRIELSDTSIALNIDCFDVKINPSQYSRGQAFDDEMYLLFQSDIPHAELGHMFSRKAILPNIDEVLELGNPLVFMSISYLGYSLGFVCFYFDATLDYYIKLPQYVSTISDSVSGFRNMKHLKYMAENIEHIYLHDYLTNLLNRSGFFKELHELMEHGHTLIEPKIFVASIDIDHLKFVNDTYSHSEGDYVVNTVADALINASLPNKLCARFGGDEMIVLALINTSMEKGFEQMGEYFKNSVLNYVDKVNIAAKKPYTISVSIGTSLSDFTGFDFDAALEKADEELLREKQRLSR